MLYLRFVVQQGASCCVLLKRLVTAATGGVDDSYFLLDRVEGLTTRWPPTIEVKKN